MLLLTFQSINNQLAESYLNSLTKLCQGQQRTSGHFAWDCLVTVILAPNFTESFQDLWFKVEILNGEMVPVATPFIAMKNPVNSPMKTSLFHIILQVNLQVTKYQWDPWEVIVRSDLLSPTTCFCNNLTYKMNKSNDNLLSMFGLIEKIGRHRHWRCVNSVFSLFSTCCCLTSFVSKF